MLRHEESEVRVLRLLCPVFVAVAVDCHDSVGVLRDNGSLRIHAEGSNPVLVLLGLVDNLALVELICYVVEDKGREFHPHSYIHPVGMGLDSEVLRDALHPLAAAATDGDDTCLCLEVPLRCMYVITLIRLLDLLGPGEEVEVDLIPQIIEYVRENLVVYIGTEVSDLCVEQMEAVLEALPLEFCRCQRRIELRLRAAVTAVYLVDVLHEGCGLILSDVLVKVTPELVRDIVLAVAESTRSAEAVHDGTRRAVNAALYLHAVNGAFPLFERIAAFDYRNLHFRFELFQFIGREYAAGTCPDYYCVVFHEFKFTD